MGKRKRGKSRAVPFAAAVFAAGGFLVGRSLPVFGARVGQVFYESNQNCDSLGICICFMGIAAVAGLGAWFCSLRAEAGEKEERRLL